MRFVLVPWCCNFGGKHKSAARLIPLGVLSLLAALRQSGWESALYDPNFEQGDHVKNLARLEGTVYGFSCAAGVFATTLTLAREVRQLVPDAMILFGGPHASLIDKILIENVPWADLVLRGEAEQSIVKLATALDDGQDLAQVPGLTFRRKGEVMRNAPVPLILDLDELPVPAYAECGVCQWPDAVIPVEIGRGCNAGCAFCSAAEIFSGRTRRKSVSRILSEIEQIFSKFGRRDIYLRHDQITTNKQWLHELCGGLRRFAPLHWQCSCRIDRIDQSILKEFADSGCSMVEYGIETASTRMQELIGKPIEPRQVREIVETTLNLGISPALFFMYAFPHEQRSDLNRTLKMMDELLALPGPARFVQMRMVEPFPGTSLAKRYLNSIERKMGQLVGQVEPKDPNDEWRFYPELFRFHCELSGTILDGMETFINDFVQTALNLFPRTCQILAQLRAWQLDQCFQLWMEKANRVSLRTLSYEAVLGSMENFIELTVKDSLYRNFIHNIVRCEHAALELCKNFVQHAQPARRMYNKPERSPHMRVFKANCTISSLISGRRVIDDYTNTEPEILVMQACSPSDYRIFSIDFQTAELLDVCDGTHTLRQISGIIKQDFKTVAEWVDQLKKSNLLT